MSLLSSLVIYMGPVHFMVECRWQCIEYHQFLALHQVYLVTWVYINEYRIYSATRDVSTSGCHHVPSYWSNPSLQFSTWGEPHRFHQLQMKIWRLLSIRPQLPVLSLRYMTVRLSWSRLYRTSPGAPMLRSSESHAFFRSLLRWDRPRLQQNVYCSTIDNTVLVWSCGAEIWL